MVETIVAALVILALAGIFSSVRAKKRLLRLDQELRKAWRDVVYAVQARMAALEELAAALRQAGYAPEGVGRLREAVALLGKNTGDPRALAEADERVEAALRGVYRALPREREERVRQAQNRMAEADEELDLRKNRYNELVFAWYELARRFPYKLFLRGKNKPEPFAVPGEEEEIFRHYSLT